MKMLTWATMAAATAIATPVHAQYYDAGPGFSPPSRIDNRQAVPTWSGQTRYGATVYFDLSDGNRGVLWQPRPGGSWFWKLSDGDQGGFSQEDLARETGYSAPLQQRPVAPAPVYQAPAPVYQAPAPVYRPPPPPQYYQAYMLGRYMRAMFGF